MTKKKQDDADLQTDAKAAVDAPEASAAPATEEVPAQATEEGSGPLSEGMDVADAHAALQATVPLMASTQDDLAGLQTDAIIPAPKGLPPGALDIHLPKTPSHRDDGHEATDKDPAAEGEEVIQAGVPVPGHLSTIEPTESDLQSGRTLPRAVSVFRRHGGASMSREQAQDAGLLHEEEENFSARSPLSSVPFFMWGALALFLALVAVLYLGDLARPLLSMMDGNVLRPNLVSFLNASSRAVGVLLAAVITLCAIAIPLTANNYTSKLLGLFTDSKVNRSMFALLIFTNLTSMTALLLVDLKGFWPLVEVSTVGTLTFLCYVMVIPYAFYIFHFLQPDEIIRHIEQEVMADLMAVKAAEDSETLELHRKRIIQNLKNLSNIALRSVDRHDRDTAMLALEALRHIIHHYFAFKHEMPEQWFRVSRMYFLSLSGEMRRRVEQGKTFLEAEVMEEFSLVLSATFGKLRDMVRMIARTIRHIGVEANEANLPAVLELTSLYFNTFLRAAISRREPEAIYMMVYHYRRMAEEMMPTNKDRPVRVAYYLSYYGHQAVRSGMIYVSNLISFDIAHMTALAYELNAPSQREIFDLFLSFDKDERVHHLPGVIKSRFKLAVYLHHLGFEEEQRLLCESLATCRREDLEICIQELGQVQTPMFWEVTDRHRHNDYLAPALFRSYAHIKAQVLH